MVAAAVAAVAAAVAAAAVVATVVPVALVVATGAAVWRVADRAAAVVTCFRVANVLETDGVSVVETPALARVVDLVVAAAAATVAVVGSVVCA